MVVIMREMADYKDLYFLWQALKCHSLVHRMPGGAPAVGCPTQTELVVNCVQGSHNCLSHKHTAMNAQKSSAPQTTGEGCFL